MPESDAPERDSPEHDSPERESLEPGAAVPAAERDLGRARAALLQAELTTEPGLRYLDARLAALRTAAVVLGVRARPSRGSRRSGPRDAWRVLGEVAPELGEWADVFGATQARYEAVRTGAAIGQREADDLVRDAQEFLGVVERMLLPLIRATARRARARPPGEGRTDTS